MIQMCFSTFKRDFSQPKHINKEKKNSQLCFSGLAELNKSTSLRRITAEVQLSIVNSPPVRRQKKRSAASSCPRRCWLSFLSSALRSAQPGCSPFTRHKGDPVSHPQWARKTVCKWSSEHTHTHTHSCVRTLAAERVSVDHILLLDYANKASSRTSLSNINISESLCGKVTHRCKCCTATSCTS